MHKNTREFLDIMNRMNTKKWNRVNPGEDFGNYTKRRSEDAGNIEDGDDPSDEAMVIARNTAMKYKK